MDKAVNPVGWFEIYVSDMTRARDFYTAVFGRELTALPEIGDEGEMSAVGLGDKEGALIVHVTSGSPSEQAGLRANDVIRSVNGHAISDLSNFAAVWHEQIGLGDATLKVWRDQAERSVVMPSP